MTCSQQRFERDVDEHKMTVLHEDGVYRHIRFRRPDSSSMHFDLITYPGYLVYSGDMGCYVFSRLTDMFEFFRTDRLHRKDPSKLYINRGYWSEKLQAVDGSRRNGSATEFCEEKFTRVINEYRVNWIREGRDSLTKDQRRELWEAVDDDVLRHLYEGEHSVYQKANDFSWSVGCDTHHYHFADLWEHDFSDYTFRFTWCCYAIAWAIRQYDEAKAPAEAEAA
ncbi:hypothetical protein LMG31506_00195 [Cupriavidus yeoncheonensis]|uniref:Uncharacterized protein n=1 Tax=Cupriavidus yeoncheonensis TaxID=1462994 RepID=A0A916NBW0_9BURK|nr:hypothetical protein [Cupriavidus yeoncheonensis]CAG2126833.1 hypothetical protein LMG31506_00195 [Cupriavidus yeoncheonensis]